MRKYRRLIPVLAGLLLVLALPLRAQLVLGQYEDEAPFRSWNAFPIITAAAQGRGGTALALASDGSAALANPALLLRLPALTLTLNGSFQTAQFYRFAAVNTGVFRSSGNLHSSRVDVDLAAAAYVRGGWAFALAVAGLETYNRPDVHVNGTSQGNIYYFYDFEQSGVLRTASLSAARRLGSKLGLGLTVGYLWGALERASLEQWVYSGYTISNRVSQDLSGFGLQAGLTWDPAPALTLGATIRAPLERKAKNHSLLTYQAASVDIRIEDTATDVIQQPWVGGLGAAFRALPGLTITADAVYFGWSKYENRFFGEIQKRDFRDVVRIGIGLEYVTRFSFQGNPVESPLRAGILYDPQPMKNPASAYVNYCLGTGLHWKSIHLDLGGMYGRESGSGRGLSGFRAQLSALVLI